MTFRAPRRRSVRWRAVEGHGLEHVTLAPEGDGSVIRGVVIGERGGTPYGVDYLIAVAADWTVRAFDLATTDGMALSVTADGGGRWTNHDGRPLPEFDGCLDVDLAGSAFTNTLPIRRLALSGAEGPVPLAMLYIPFDTFVPVRDRQVYTPLPGGRRFRYEAADRSFAAELAVDSDGLVRDYPGLFERVADPLPANPAAPTASRLPAEA